MRAQGGQEADLVGHEAELLQGDEDEDSDVEMAIEDDGEKEEAEDLGSIQMKFQMVQSRKRDLINQLRVRRENKEKFQSRIVMISRLQGPILT